jgi:hypothetical protein
MCSCGGHYLIRATVVALQQHSRSASKLIDLRALQQATSEVASLVLCTVEAHHAVTLRELSTLLTATVAGAYFAMRSVLLHDATCMH